MRTADRRVALGLLAFSAWWGYLTYNLPGKTVENAPGPRFFPWVLVISLAILSVVLLWQSRGTGSEAGRGKTLSTPDWIKVAATLALIFAYTYLIGLIGFIYASGIVLVLFFRFIVDVRNWLTILSGSALVATAVHVIFRMILRVPLPTGKLF